MSFKMNCPRCGKTLIVAEKTYGKTLPCPNCNQPVAVPIPSESRQSPKPSDSCVPLPQLPLAGEIPATASLSAATRVCEWCAESIPRQALKCPRCTKWRRDIGVDIQNQFAGLIGAVVCFISSGPFIGIALVNEEWMLMFWSFAILALLMGLISLCVCLHAGRNLKRKTGSV